MSEPTPLRERLIDHAQRYLTRTGSPKFMLALLLAATGATGFLTSVGLLHAGVTSMTLRYPLAVMAAYAVFLVLLGLWLSVQRAGDPAGEMLPMGVAALTPLPAKPPPPPTVQRTTGDQSGWWWFFGSGDSGGDDGCAVVMVVLLIGLAVVSAVTACLWIVADAPILLGELLVDGAVLAAVAPGLNRAEPHWLRTVVLRTWKKALALVLIFGLVGAGLESIEPGARTMGEAFRMAQADRR